MHLFLPNPREGNVFQKPVSFCSQGEGVYDVTSYQAAYSNSLFGGYDVTSCLAAWSHNPSEGGCLPPGGFYLQGGLLPEGGLTNPGTDIYWRQLRRLVFILLERIFVEIFSLEGISAAATLQNLNVS